MCPRTLDSYYNESEGRFSMQAPRCPLVRSAVSPFFVLACAVASTFHACEGTLASTWKDDALSLRGAPSWILLAFVAKGYTIFWVQISLNKPYLVPGKGLEPSLPKERDFESLVYTIPPPRQVLPRYYSEKDVFTRSLFINKYII